MEKRSGQTLMLLSMLFVFFCLLLSGGSNLIAGDIQENTIPDKSFSAIRAVLSSAPAPRIENGCQMRNKETFHHLRLAPVPEVQELSRPVQSDSNGNVLAAGTYMRAVYQAFVLDDGFV